jgi:hypothetical protein
MNDIYIYKQKAEKYKYKYLKLKQELYGSGNHCTYNLPIKFENDSFNFELDDSGKLKIVTDYPINTPNSDFKKFNIQGNNGRILNYEDYEVILKLLKNSELKYTNIVYTCTIYKEKRIGYFKRFGKKNYIKDKFTNCPIFNKSDKYGFIITENIKGLDMENLINNNIELFIQFINHLILTLKNFIIPLHNAGYILNNINFNNIIWNKDEKKVYFNILNITKDTNKYKDIKDLISSITKLEPFVDYHNTKKLLFNNDKIMSIEKLIDNLPNINKYIEYEKEIIKYEKKISDINEKFLSAQINQEIYIFEDERNTMNSNIGIFKNKIEYVKKEMLKLII